ncbi:hypothetical protein [Streptomyces sp. NPDC088115]|uniref:hypothetical protein n=1 Tax=Streptomyces sp. NPDC088115 TaxID=3365824 RepID=UPI0037F12B16
MIAVKRVADVQACATPATGPEGRTASHRPRGAHGLATAPRGARLATGPEGRTAEAAG